MNINHRSSSQPAGASTALSAERASTRGGVGAGAPRPGRAGARQEELLLRLGRPLWLGVRGGVVAASCIGARVFRAGRLRWLVGGISADVPPPPSLDAGGATHALGAASRRRRRGVRGKPVAGALGAAKSVTHVCELV